MIASFVLCQYICFASLISASNVLEPEAISAQNAPPTVPCLGNWLPADYAEVLIIGSNFGTEAQFAALADLSVSIGGLDCKPRSGNALVYESNTRCGGFESQLSAELLSS